MAFLERLYGRHIQRGEVGTVEAVPGACPRMLPLASDWFV